MTGNISTAHILRTQDLITTIMTGCIVLLKVTNLPHQAVLLHHQVPRQAVRPRHQVPHQAVRPRLQVPLLRQQLQHVSYSQYKNGIHV